MALSEGGNLSKKTGCQEITRHAGPDPASHSSCENAIADRASLVRNDELCHAELASFCRNLLISCKMGPLGVVSASPNNQLDCHDAKAPRNDENSSRFTPHSSQKCAAFTLAEVLITLGIIGIVAIITMPTLINNIQDRQNRAKWKKEYSILSNAFQQTLSDGIFVCSLYNDLYGSCDDLNKDFVELMISKLNVVEVCNSASICDTDYVNGHLVFGKHPWAGISGNDVRSFYKPLGVKSTEGYAVCRYNFGTYTYLLNDGAAVYFGGLWDGPWIVVDVNNFTKGPNEIGRDVFIIKLFSNIKQNQHWMKPAGAQGTPNWNNAESGSSGCSKDIGAKSTTRVYDAAGAGCSAKYLLE